MSETLPLRERVFGTLFYLTEPVTLEELAPVLETDIPTLTRAVDELAEELAHRGIRLLRSASGIALVTAPELADTLLALKKDALASDIGKAGAETLAIILYTGSATRARIDEIRGVQSGATVRNLMVRGLIERVEDAGTRSHTYRATPELYAHLGITERGQLEDFDAVMQALENFE